MRICYLEEFIELSSDLNFTAAARRINLSVSALSTHISALEAATGCTLINRTTRSLTPEGESFLDYAYKIVDLYTDAVSKCHKIKRDLAGTVRIDKSINASTTGYRFREFIYDFSNTYNKVNVQLTQSLNTDFVDSLKEGHVDVAMVATVAPDAILALLRENGMDGIYIGEEEICVWCSVDGPLGDLETVTLNDLSKCGIAHSKEWRLDIWRESLRALLEPVGATPHIRINHFSSLTDFALSNIPDDEISLVTESSAEGTGILRLRNDRVLKHFDPPLNIHTLVCYRVNEQNPAVNLFIEVLYNSFLSEEEKADQVAQLKALTEEITSCY